jgi:hypothetical protein
MMSLRHGTCSEGIRSFVLDCSVVDRFDLVCPSSEDRIRLTRLTIFQMNCIDKIGMSAIQNSIRMWLVATMFGRNRHIRYYQIPGHDRNELIDLHIRLLTMGDLNCFRQEPLAVRIILKIDLGLDMSWVEEGIESYSLLCDVGLPISLLESSEWNTWEAV